LLKRLINHQEECALRLVHHQFDGLSKPSAAQIMGITVSRLNQILNSVKRKIPQMFPILTSKQYKVSQLLNEGETHLEIANKMGLSIKQVDNIVGRLHRLGIPVYRRPKTVSYNPGLDGEVVRKF